MVQSVGKSLRKLLKLRVFVLKCLTIILRIRWPLKVSNKSVREKCNQEDISYILRRPPNDITKEPYTGPQMVDANEAGHG